MTDSRQAKTIRRATLATLVALLPLTGCGTTADASRTASTTTGSTTPGSPPPGSATTASTTTTAPVARGFKDLESEYGARLGVWALDTGTGRTVTWRAGE